MDHRYWNVYKTFVLDIISSKSFPLFVIYLISTSFCYKWKKISSAVDFPRFLCFYNIVISVVNVLCFIGFMTAMINSDSLFSKKPDAFLRNVYLVYWVTKVVELSDTVFMILRHKFRQVSPLHVYHHATMLILSEIGYRKYCWAAFAMPLMLNAFVHVVLYLYYGLTAIGIHPPWKKQLTEIQIVQFLIDLVHASIGLLHHNFCTWSIMYALSMIYLFGSFYYRTYLKTNKAVNNIPSMEERKKIE